MSVKSIFIQTHAPHQSRLVHGFDSMVNSGACSIGFIKGDYRQINALVTEDYTENDGEFKHEVRQFEKSYDNQQAEQISLMV
ncbi:hypothetical protein A7N09_20540 [Acinetobacter baumannii]|nr:hypothetical protein A7N09_20540 [Acinetobacter baumannii]